tara:strand:- start:2085 stop:3086 length:1002 start_codon:yes stop_codon:yes gene_type:complete
MDLGNYSLVRADETADWQTTWDAFVAASPEGTVFSETPFLSSLNAKAGLWYCLRGEEKAAAVCVMESNDGREAVSYPNVIYNGIMFAPPPAKQNHAQVISEQFRILAFLSGELTEIYDSISMTFHPSITDMRPFQWHNYHNEGPRYVIDIRYTNVLLLAKYRSETGMEDAPGYMEANKSRRQELRYAIKKDYRTEETFDPQMFIDMYRSTFARQNLSMDGTGIEELPAMLDAMHAAGQTRMFVTRTSDGTPASIGIFARDAKRWYYQFGAGNPDLRDGHAGSLMLWDAMAALAEDGDMEIDLEGVNSPQRGYFKLSFGGTLTPYYRVRYSAAG